MILSVTAVALLWNFIYFPNEKGILNSLLIKIGLFKLYAAMACKSENITDVLDYCKHMDKCWLLYDYLFSRDLPRFQTQFWKLVNLTVLQDGKNLEYLYTNVMGTVKMSTIMVITGVLKIFDTVYILTPTGGTNNCTDCSWFTSDVQ